MRNRAQSKEVFETLPAPQALWAMAAPTIISQIIVLIYNLADTFFIGQTNNPYMVAGVSLVFPVFNITLSIASFTGMGGGSLISRLLGKDRRDEASRVSVFSVYSSALIAALFSLIMACFMQPILDLLGAGENTRLYAGQYALCVIVLGGIPTVMSNVLANLIRSTGMSRQAGFGIMMGGLINIALDPLFMFVLMPKGSEILGVGTATFLSNCISCSYFLLVIYKNRKNSVVSLNLKRGMPERKSISDIFYVGLPSAMSALLFDLDYVVLDKLMVAYGDISLAAIGIVVKAERFPLNVGIGICQGMMPLVAYNFSSGNHKRMDEIINYSVKVGLITAALSVMLYELLSGNIIHIFIKNPATLALGTDYLRIRCLATPLMFLSFFTMHLFQAFGQGNNALFLSVMRWAVFNIPMLFILNAAFGMYGLVWSQVTADSLNVALSFYVYRRARSNGFFV